MRRVVLFLPAVIILLIVASDSALGCVCFGLSEKPTPEQAKAMLVEDFNDAFAVFSGEVIALDTFKLKLKVEKLWKGDFGDEITMSTGAKDNGDGTYTSSSCDFSFRSGGKYLVYAYGGSREEMQARQCTRTRELKHAEQEVKDLDAIWPPLKRNTESKQEGKEVLPPPGAKSNPRLHPTEKSAGAAELDSVRLKSIANG